MKSLFRFTTKLVLFGAFAIGQAQQAHAGFIEFGASGTYRLSNIGIDAYDESSSITGSMGYYFDESSSIDLSYTDGRSKRWISFDKVNGSVTNLYYKSVGLDFVYTFGTRASQVRPYIKGGANYIISKSIVEQQRDGSGNVWAPNVIEDSPGLVPSAGLGIRIGLTDNLSLKLGVDAWSSRPLNRSPRTYDWFGRAGLSFIF